MTEIDLITETAEHFHVYLERDPRDHACCMGKRPLDDVDVGWAVNRFLDDSVVGIGDKIIVEFLPGYPGVATEEG